MFPEFDGESILRAHRMSQGLEQYSDTTNAERLIRDNKNEIRYNAFWKKWLVWNGKYWELDEGDVLIHTKGLETIRRLYLSAMDTQDLYRRIEIEKFATQSESMSRRKACVEAASKSRDIQIGCDGMDRDEFLLSVENGTVNLATGEFREHRPEDFITKIARVEYDPEADCPAWKQFLREIMDYNGELISFLQKAAGWGVTGNTSEQVMFILFGSGANGKSTFLNTIMKILGDYATSTPTETFMKQKSDKITNDIARLRGTRFVSTTEAEQGERLSEHLIKQITGQDVMTARFLYGEFFSFVPTFKIFMATNHKPVIKGSDHGIWRRIVLIPFTTTIPKERQDIELESKLLAEAPGILNWLIEGAMKWRAERLCPPAVITDATDEYRAEMDIIGNFIKECCLQGEGLSIRIRELFKTYQEWCDGNNEHAVSERIFGLKLKEIGFKQIRTSEARFWQGLSLKPSAG
jgi:putative DNA primase/helicase